MVVSLVLIGIGVSLIGTLVGAGGGFLVVPLLVLFYSVPPVIAAGTSLLVVTVNALVGTLAHIKHGKIDYRGALLLSLSAYPGTLIGAWLADHLDASHFAVMFGLLLIAMAAWMAYRMLRGDKAEVAASSELRPEDRPWFLVRELRLADGSTYCFAFSLPLAVGVSLIIGVLGALFGIGGGPIIVPFLIFGLGYPVHVAAATSQLNIALTSAGAAAWYAVQGNVIVSYFVSLSLGVLIGSPLGAWHSTRIKARNLIWIMVMLLLILGIRLVS